LNAKFGTIIASWNQDMSKFYVACEFGTEQGRVVLGHLEKEKLSLSEVRKFPNIPIRQKGSIHWDIPRLHQEMLEGLRTIGSFEETIESISCTSWAGDYLLFEKDGTLITPTFHQDDPRWVAGRKWVNSRISAQQLYEETGMSEKPANTLFQIGAESSRRLSQAACLLPVADGFNHLLGGAARVESSLASATQMYSPLTGSWAESVLGALRLPRNFLPPVVLPGTRLGQLHPEISGGTGLEGAQILSTRSNELAASLAGLPREEDELCAFLRIGSQAEFGREIERPLINPSSQNLKFRNEGGGSSFQLFKPVPGTRLIENCQKFWKEKEREVGAELLLHLAGAAAPLESFIDPEDERFAEGTDMPLKIQAYCRETNQAIPRKPGAIIRCILESLALTYRKTKLEVESQTGKKVERVYLLKQHPYGLLNHFTANALQVPVVVASPDASAIGNIVVQAFALGHLRSMTEARDIVRKSFRHETIVPYATAWSAAFERLNALRETRQ
jgi:rhamnulokinase